jgi:iron complex transport system substrate-binding protein
LFKRACVLLVLCAALPARASGVVSLNLCTDQLLVLLAPNRIAALSPLARDPALSTVAQAARHLPWVRPDAEAVLALHPDLVLAGVYGAQSVVTVMKQNGVPVVQVAEASDFNGVAGVITSVAKALGADTAGATLVAHMRLALAAVPHAARGTAILWEPRGFSAGPGGFGDAVLRAAGYRNTGSGREMGVETLAAHPPDVLITAAAPAYPSLATDLLWHPALAGLKRRIVAPAWLACPGPWAVAAVAALAAP